MNGTAGKKPKKILLIGGVGAGKTTLKQALSDLPLIYQKTQVLNFGDVFIDCPGEYLEIPRYYHVLIDLSHRVAEIWALQDATRPCGIYPPKFACVFKKPVIGVITKIDLPQANVETARLFLNNGGIPQPYYEISALHKQNTQILRTRIESLAN
ncbi:EutP/PduV family microcompartment system protein [Desulfitobacterium chlororespirans]|uniref:Ethanolamine utilization protein EutP n=1 Tax=Desulfitobacterium chlororespirans DSM 11544 TaxID=1121395 RepID=A0A1M7TDT8_9FIRM|nr:EutP/PduV family microcompartment system protein [Desulfitobacterium chlororespirans]SHN68899.1 ethanolamine utilization protein EutP [Desulfitobacterium chlororespirans DSM 11544]